MDFDETMVEEGFDETESTAEIDALTDDGIIEEAEEPDESLESLSEEAEAPAEEQTETQGTSEPGYVQRRVQKALERERANIKAEIQAEMEARYAPIRDRLLEMDAKELVKQGEFKSFERAKEYLQMKQGINPQAVVESRPVEQPRQANGQFASREDQETSNLIDRLAEQADIIREVTGVDVIEEFSNNEEIKNAVISGDMDFIDLAKQMQGQKRKRPPAPTRSPNGVNGQFKSTIMALTDKQFELLEKKVQGGARFRE